MADPTPGTIPALPPLIGSLGTGVLFEISNSGVSQSVTSDQIAAFAAGPDGSVPSSRIVATPSSGGLSGGGDLSADLSLSMTPNSLTAKTTPVAADAVVINNSSGNTPAKTTLSDFYKSIAGLTLQVSPVSTTYEMVLYNSGDGNTYRSTLQDALAASGTLPTGGTTGQVLVKTSNADFATGWSGTAGTVTSVTVSPGTGLSGGGTITTSGTVTLTLANTAVTAASYGSSSASPTFTVDAQGRLTAAANATITPTAIGAVPTTRTITAGTGLTGGGDLSANRTLAIDVTGVAAATYGDSTHVAQVAVNTQGQITSASSVAISVAGLGVVQTSRTLTAGTGLTGGGDLSANRTFTLANTAVTPGSYGTASTVGTFTVDQQGRITAATPTTITPAAIGAVPITRAVNTATGLTGGGALSSDLTINYNIPALANKASPSSVSDLVLIWDAAASAYKNATVGSIGSAGSVSSFNSRTGAVVPASGDYSLAQLAMTTGSRILATDASGVSGASAITFASSNAGFPGTINAVGQINITSGVTGTLSGTAFNVGGTSSDLGISINNLGTGGHSYSIIAPNNGSGLPAGSLVMFDATANDIRFIISPAGNVGIGTGTPSNTLDVNGNVNISGQIFGTSLTFSQPTGNATPTITTSQDGVATAIGTTAYFYNSISVTNDNTTTSFVGTSSRALNVFMSNGGADNGSKIAIHGHFHHDTASNPGAASGDDIAGQFSAWASASYGGTDTGSGAVGTIFGCCPLVIAGVSGNATNLLEVCGGEVDIGILAGSSSRYRFGWSMVSIGDTQAAQFDAALEIGAAGTGWRYGLLFCSIHGSSPMSSDGVLIGTDGSTLTVNGGIDFSSYTFTDAAFRSKGIVINGVGGVVIDNNVSVSWLGTTGANYALAQMGADDNFYNYGPVNSTLWVKHDGSAVNMSLSNSGNLSIIGNVGFNGTSPPTKPTVTGSRGGNAALASLITALANYGLITDGTSA